MLAAYDLARRVHQPDDREAGDGLTGPDSPTSPSTSPSSTREAHAVHRLDHAGLGEEVGSEVLDLEGITRIRGLACGRLDRFERLPAHRSLGLSTSRS